MYLLFKGQFYPPDLFCRYNMFNNHFFDGDLSRTVCQKFLHCNHGEGVVMVTDPPFGGRVEVLAAVIKQMMSWWKEGSNSKTALIVMFIFEVLRYK